MASQSALTGFREADAAGRPFETAYYNTEIHQAAFATPVFLRKRFADL